MTCDYIKALEFVRQGNWDAAHKTVQPFSDELSCWIHAYLHRVEGDPAHAVEWYQRGGMDMPDNTLEEEFARLYRIVQSI